MPDYIQKSSAGNALAIPKAPRLVAKPLETIVPLTPMEYGFTLDRSDSMTRLWEKAITGFNLLLAEQPRVPGVDSRFSANLFNDTVKTIYNRVPLAEVRELSNKEYAPDGSTALLDGIGEVMNAIGPYWDKQRIKPRVLIAILTDGAENSSEKFGHKQIFEMIHYRRLACNWQFLYFCADEQGVRYGLGLGIQRVNIVRFDADPEGIKALLHRVSKAFKAYALGDRNYSRLLLGDGKNNP